MWDPLEKVACGCGGTVTRCNLAIHRKSKKHQYYVEHGFPKPIMIDTEYPVGSYRRTRLLRISAQTRYHLKKQEEKKKLEELKDTLNSDKVSDIETNTSE
jgi:hypothetical protein